MRLSDHLNDIDDNIRRAGKVWVGCDFDGTLAPLVDDPWEATVDPLAAAAVARLAACRAAAVAIISGRALSDIRPRMGLSGIAYAGNHGAEIDAPGLKLTDQTAGEAGQALGVAHHRLAESRLTLIQGVVNDHKKYSLSVDYRAVPPAERGPVIAEVEAAAAGLTGLHVLHGLHGSEIRANGAWNKGSAALRLHSAPGGTGRRADLPRRRPYRRRRLRRPARRGDGVRRRPPDGRPVSRVESGRRGDVPGLARRPVRATVTADAETSRRSGRTSRLRYARHPGDRPCRRVRPASARISRCCRRCWIGSSTLIPARRSNRHKAGRRCSASCGPPSGGILELLLNTRQRFAAVPAEYGEVAKSILTYGLADFSGYRAVRAKERAEMCRKIEGVIRRNESRLLAVKVELITDGDPTERTLRFRIDALMRADPAPEPVVFDTVMEPSTTTFTVGGEAA